MLLACVQVTRRVRGERRGARFDGVSWGFGCVVVVVMVAAAGSGDGDEDGGVREGVHHFSTSFCRDARSTHGAMLASWSMLDTTISSPSAKSSAKETLRRSCVVEGPKTGRIG